MGNTTNFTKTFKIISVLLFALLFSLIATANTTTFNGTTNTDWNTSTNWSAGVPTATSDVTIAANVVISSSETALANTITVSAGKSLTNNGTLTINMATATSVVSGIVLNHAIFDNEGTLSVTSAASKDCITLNGSAGGSNSNTFKANGTCSFTVATAKYYVFNAGGTDPSTINGTGFTIGTSGTGGVSYGLINLTVAASVTIASGTTLTDYFNYSAATGTCIYITSGTLTNNGTLNINQAGTLTNTTYPVEIVSGATSNINFTNAGTFSSTVTGGYSDIYVTNSAAGGTVTLTNSGTMTISSTYGINIASGVNTTVNNTGNLSISNAYVCLDYASNSAVTQQFNNTGTLSLSTSNGSGNSCNILWNGTPGTVPNLTNTGTINLTSTAHSGFIKGATTTVAPTITNNTGGIINFYYPLATTVFAAGSGIYPVLTNSGGTVEGYNVTLSSGTFVSSTGTLAPQSYSGGIGTITLPSGYSLTGTLKPQITSTSAYGQLIAPSLVVTSATLSISPSYTPVAADSLYLVNWTSGSSTFSNNNSLATGWGLNYNDYTFINATFYSAAPGVPTGVHCASDNAQVTVAFTGSTVGGGAASYTVTPYIGSTAQATTKGTASPIVVTGLTNGTAYTFKVSATNPLGTSAQSTASAPATPSVQTQLQKDIDTIAARISNNITGGNVSDDSITYYLSSVWNNTTGSWSDINYTIVSPQPGFETNVHFTRIEALAIAFTQPGIYYHSPAVMNEINKGLAYYHNNLTAINLATGSGGNGWFEWIGYPQDICAAIMLVRDDMDSTVESYTMNYLKSLADSSYLTTDWNTGQNLSWVNDWEIEVGCIQKDSAMIAKVVAAEATLMNTTTGTNDGLKVDYAYFQHFMNYNGGYSSWIVSDILNYPVYIKGTTFNASFPITTIGDYILNGEYWFQFHNYADLVPQGREFSSPGMVGYVGGTTLNTMSTLDPSRASQYQAYLNHEYNNANYSQPGTKHYFTSDIMVHRDSTSYMSVKIPTIRNELFEIGNYQNLKGYNMGYGFTQLLTVDSEYYNIEPVWDWTRLPGTTTKLGLLDTNSTAKTGGFYRPYGTNTFGGGVSDSTYGVMAFTSTDNTVTATKSYFFLGNAMVCLGSGIASTYTGHTVTSVDQSNLSGSVVLNNNGTQSTFSGPPTTYTNTLQWVQHNNIGYYFPSQTAKIIVDTTTQTGNWYNINHGSNTNLSKNVFSVYFDHGIQPTTASYQYIVVPNVADTMASWVATNNPYTILKNTTNIQCVKNSSLNLYGIVFYAAGSDTLDNNLIVSVNKPAIVMVSGIIATGNQIKVSVEDPTYTASNAITVTLKLVGSTSPTKTLTTTMPTGNYLGSTVTTQFSTDLILIPPTLGTFTVGTKTYGAAPFKITPPSSNSGGAFTYTSSNLSVATISHDTITIVGAGSSTITANQASLGNYASATTTATFTVNKASLTVTANNQSKTYGTTLSLGTTAFTTSGLLFSDAITSATLTSTGSVNTAAAGTYNIVPSAASGNGLSNYTITYVNGTLTVNKAVLTITAANQNVNYGSSVVSVTSAGTYTPTGFLNGDNSSVISGTATYTTNYTTTTPVGATGITITPVVSGLGATSYSFSPANGTITVVNPNPSAPTIGTAVAGDGEASVTFTAPSSLGFGATSITSYTVTSSPGSLTGTGATSPIQVSGLSNGTAYTFTVTATNNLGYTGPASAATGSVTPSTAIYWTGNAGNGLWSSGNNWNGGNVPNANDDVTIGSYTVTISSGVTAYANTVTLSTAGGKLTNNGTLTINTATASTPSIVLTDATLDDEGTLNVTTASSSCVSIVGSAGGANSNTLTTNGTENFVSTTANNYVISATGTDPITINGTGFQIGNSTTGISTGLLSSTGGATITIGSSGNLNGTVITNYYVYTAGTGKGVNITVGTLNNYGNLTISQAGTSSVANYPIYLASQGSSSPIAFNNYGTFSSTASTGSNPTAIEVTQTTTGGTVTLSNSGTISINATYGLVVAAGVNSTFTNTGTMSVANSYDCLNFTSNSAVTQQFNNSGNLSLSTNNGSTNSNTIIWNGSPATAPNLTNTGTVTISSTANSGFIKSAITSGSQPTITNNSGGTFNFIYPNATTVFTTGGFDYPLFTNSGGTVAGYNVTFPASTLVTNTSPLGTFAPSANGSGTGTITLPASYALYGTLSPQVTSGTAYGILGGTTPNVTNATLSLTTSYAPTAGSTLQVISGTPTGPFLSPANTSTDITTSGTTGWGVTNASTPNTIEYFSSAPGVPTSPSATAGNAQALVSFTAPTVTGGGVTNYTVTPYIAGVAQTVLITSGATSPITVTGLANGTAYTFTVTATNPAGTSAASAATGSVTPSTSIYWTGLAGDGLWATANNWSGASVPTATENITVGNYAVTIATGYTAYANTLTLSTAGGSITNNGTLTINTATASTPSLVLTDASFDNEGTLNITTASSNCVSIVGSAGGANSSTFTTNGTENFVSTTANNYVFSATGTDPITINGSGFQIGTSGTGVSTGLLSSTGGATITIGSSGNLNGTVITDDYVYTSGTGKVINITAGTLNNYGNLTISQAGTSSVANYPIYIASQGSGNPITYNNYGTFSATASTGSNPTAIEVTETTTGGTVTLTNSGTITISATYGLIITNGTNTTFTNSGTMSVANSYDCLDFSSNSAVTQQFNNSGTLSLSTNNGSTNSNTIIWNGTPATAPNFTNTGIVNINSTANSGFVKSAITSGSQPTLTNSTGGTFNFNYPNATTVFTSGGFDYPVLTNSGGTVTGFNITFPSGTYVSSTGTLAPQANGSSIGTITLPTGYSLTGTLKPQINSTTAYGQLVCPTITVTGAKLQIAPNYTPTTGDSMAVVKCTTSKTVPFGDSILPSHWGIDYTKTGYIYARYNPSKYSSTQPSSAITEAAINFTDIAATKNSGGVAVNWSVSVQLNIASYTVERSVDAGNFVDLSSVKATGTSNYLVEDANIPATAATTLQYRIKVIGNDGSIQYSKVATLKLSIINYQLSIFPNPTQSILNIKLNAANSSLCKVRILTLSGLEVFSKTGIPANGATIAVPVSRLASGVYVVELIDGEGNKQLQKFVKD